MNQDTVRVDRLTALLNRFRLNVSVPHAGPGNLAVMAEDAGQYIRFCASGDCIQSDIKSVFSLQVQIDGEANPLLTALPDELCEPVKEGGELAGLVALIEAEISGARCGSSAVLTRLVEILVVRLLRGVLEQGLASPGLLGGLSHPRIARSIVAIHEFPERRWQNVDLAMVAGLSLSRFKQLFGETVGETPASYLRRWRMTLARGDLERGDRVDRVAARYGYRAPDAFSRAYANQFGHRPRDASAHWRGAAV
ncbi:MAG: AraC family transcriptional regulator [Paracoccaceae bacterium]